MKRFKILFTALVVIFAVSSAFTTANKFKRSDVVWFPVVSGTVQTSSGVNQDDPPTDCKDQSGDLCAQSYDISLTTPPSGSGFYTLNAGEEDNFIDQSFRDDHK